VFLRPAKHVLLLSIALAGGGCVTSQAAYVTNSVHPPYRTAIDALGAPAIAAASDAIVVVRCDEGCQLPIGGGNPRYRLSVERVLFARSGIAVPSSIVLRGSEAIEIPRGESFMSVARRTTVDQKYDFFLTSQATSVGVRRGNSVLYRTIEGGARSYDLRRDSWIGCFYRSPRSTRCSDALLRSLNVTTPAQRAAYHLLQDSDYAIGLFWGADVQAYPKSEFPSAPCAPGQSLAVCTAIQLNAFNQKIAFQPSD
jgi:hypothetical protein